MAHSPTQRQIEAFEKAVIAVGGGIQPDPCISEELPAIHAGDYYPSAEQGSGLYAKMDIEAAYTSGCGNHSRAAVPYDQDPDEEKRPPVHGRFVGMCVVCDAGARWPRFV